MEVLVYQNQLSLPKSLKQYQGVLDRSDIIEKLLL